MANNNLLIQEKAPEQAPIRVPVSGPSIGFGQRGSVSDNRDGNRVMVENLNSNRAGDNYYQAEKRPSQENLPALRGAFPSLNRPKSTES